MLAGRLALTLDRTQKPLGTFLVPRGFSCFYATCVPGMSPGAKCNSQAIDTEAIQWSLRQESNLYLALRRRPFYPLNYGERQTAIVNARGGSALHAARRAVCRVPGRQSLRTV